MERKLSPEEAKSVVEAVTRLLSNSPEPAKAAVMSPEDYHTILVAGNHSDDALPDLSVLYKAELDWCYKHRWETKASIDHSTITGRQQWSWIMESFCCLYNGADLRVDRIFTMFQIHMAFADRNEEDPKRLFKFGILDAYCALTDLNKGLSKRKQNWKLNLDRLKIWVANETKNQDDEPELATKKPPKASQDTFKSEQLAKTRAKSHQNTNNSKRKRSRGDAGGDEKDLEGGEQSEVPRNKRKVKGSCARKSVERAAEVKVKKETQSKRCKRD